MSKHAKGNQRVTCTLCGHRVRDSLKMRWKHIAESHVDVLAARLLPLLEGGARGVYAMGAALGESLKKGGA